MNYSEKHNNSGMKLVFACNILHVLIFHLEKPLSYAFPLANFEHSFTIFSSVSNVDLEHLNVACWVLSFLGSENYKCNFIKSNLLNYEEAFRVPDTKINFCQWLLLSELFWFVFIFYIFCFFFILVLWLDFIAETLVHNICSIMIRVTST